MGGGQVTKTGGRLSVLVRRHPVMLVLAAYGFSRLFNLVVFALIARNQSTSVSDLLFRWDSVWLVRAAKEGWPIPDGGLSEVSQLQTTWAWPPLAPLTGRWLSNLTGVDVQWALAFVNVSLGAVAAVILWRVACEAFGPRVGIRAAVLWSAMPASPVLLMAYAEGLFVALAFASLLLMQRSRFVLAGLVLIPAGLTKVQVVPFAATLVVVLLYQRWQRGPGVVGSGALVFTPLLAVVSVAAWPLYVAFRFGSLNAYAQVQAAWNIWEAWPLVGTLKWSVTLVTSPNRATAFAFLALAMAIAAMLYLLKRRERSAVFTMIGVMGPLFLMAVGAGVSTVRFALSLPSIPAALGLWARSRKRFVPLLAALAVSQVAWLLIFVAAGPTEMPP